MAIPGNLGSVAINEVGEAVAFGAGFALGRILEPAAVDLAQTAWDVAPVRALGAAEAAAVAAESVDAYDAMQAEARRSGYDAERFKNLYGVTLNAPGQGLLITMLRRGTIADDDYTHGLRKEKWETRYDDALHELRTERVAPADIARGIQRGLWTDPGILPVGPPSTEGKVRAFPVVQLDPLKEAAAWGYDKERLAALVGLVGLPASNTQAAQGFFRGILERADFDRAIAEGNTRNEWGEAILEVARQIPTPSQFEEAALRGILTNAQADAGAALHGMTPEHAQLLFQIMGRSLAVHQITTGLARGGTYGGTYNDVPEPFRDAIRRSNIRPEYAVLAHANRYTYPSAFVLRSMAQTGELTFEETHQTLLDIGWKPDFAEKVATIWAGGTKTKGDTHVTKAETQVWSALHKSYVDNLSTDGETTTDLSTLGVAAASIPEVLSLWQTERAIIRRSLTPAQIKKAIGEPGRDTAWATTRLTQLGYTAEDAATFLAE